MFQVYTVYISITLLLREPHTIHVFWYISLLSYHKNRPNAGKYTSSMDGMGTSNPHSVIRVFFAVALNDTTTLFKVIDARTATCARKVPFTAELQLQKR